MVRHAVAVVVEVVVHTVAVAVHVPRVARVAVVRDPVAVSVRTRVHTARLGRVRNPVVVIVKVDRVRNPVLVVVSHVPVVHVATRAHVTVGVGQVRGRIADVVVRVGAGHVVKPVVQTVAVSVPARRRPAPTLADIDQAVIVRIAVQIVSLVRAVGVLRGRTHTRSHGRVRVVRIVHVVQTVVVAVRARRRHVTGGRLRLDVVRDTVVVGVDVQVVRHPVAVAVHRVVRITASLRVVRDTVVVSVDVKEVGQARGVEVRVRIGVGCAVAVAVRAGGNQGVRGVLGHAVVTHVPVDRVRKAVAVRVGRVAVDDAVVIGVGAAGLDYVGDGIAVRVQVAVVQRAVVVLVLVRVAVRRPVGVGVCTGQDQGVAAVFGRAVVADVAVDHVVEAVAVRVREVVGIAVAVLVGALGLDHVRHTVVVTVEVEEVGIAVAVGVGYRQ